MPLTNGSDFALNGFQTVHKFLRSVCFFAQTPSINGKRVVILNRQYTVSEVSDKASSGYILPADQKVTIKTDETATVTFLPLL